MRSGLVKALVRGFLVTASSAGPTLERRRSTSGTSRWRRSLSWPTCAPATWGWSYKARWSPRPRRSPAPWEDVPRPGAGHGDQAGYGAVPAAYHSLVEQATQTLSIPVVASLNGVSRGGWVRYAARLEQAGADALELNIYYVSSRPGRSASEVEWHYLDVVRSVRQAIGIPLVVKLSPYFSSLVNLAGQLVEAGANGLVLFNRFYQPDLDIEAMEVLPALELSTSVQLRPVEIQVRDWMDGHGFETLDQFRGRLSQRSVPDPAAFERANYLKTLA